jgi:restriction endonuclease S subunit
MPLKQFTTDFQNIGQQEFLRLNVGYRYFFDVQKTEIYPAKQSIKLKYVLKEIPAKKVSKGLLDDSEILVDIGNIERRFNNLTNLEEVDEIGSDKTILQAGDIIIPKMQPQMGNIFLNLKHKRYIGSTELLEYLISKNYSSLFLYYLITSKKLLSDLANLESGKTHRRVNSTDLLKIKIPLIPKSTQDQIVAQIEPIEKKIKELKAQITPPKEIINKVFAREVGFDLEKLGELKKEKFFEVNFPKISNYHSLRFDVKNQKYLDVFNDIIKDFGSSFFLKSISKDKGKYGANEPAKDGEKGIDTRYIRITDVDSVGNLSDDDWKTAENIAEEYLLKDDDFLFARSGNTVGKTFLYDSNKHEEAIFAGYFIKFNLDFTNLDKLFFLYYTKSFIYNFWIRGIVRIKGQPNINANEYLELKIPNITLKDQQKIVDEIKIELDKQEEINKKIQTERNKIDEIIEKAIV